MLVSSLMLLKALVKVPVMSSIFMGESRQFMGAYHFSKYVFMCSN